MSQICPSICKAGEVSRTTYFRGFAAILDLNMKRTAMQVDYSDVSGNEFMMNLLCVVRHLAEPVVQGEWKMLEEADQTYPQSNRRINYEDET
jgi:Ubiquitin elongating factor core